MTLIRRHGWRLALLASGLAMVVGGPMHPSSDAEDSMREELATMTGDGSWVTGHSLAVLSAVLLALGLWAVLRGRVWPRAVDGPLRVAAVAVSVYVVETILHLAAVVDHDALAAGEAAPVAFAHIGLAAFLYPASGLALAYLGGRLFTTWQGPRRLVALPGIVGGTVHALSVPLTILLPDVELTPLFAGSAIVLALWSVLLAVASAPVRQPTQPRVPVPVA